MDIPKYLSVLEISPRRVDVNDNDGLPHHNTWHEQTISLLDGPSDTLPSVDDKTFRQIHGLLIHSIVEAYPASTAETMQYLSVTQGESKQIVSPAHLSYARH